MLFYLTLIFCCQLAGEMFVTVLGLPLPGPVAGMVLLFVPAGVGVMLHARLIGADWLPLSAGLVISTALTIVVTAAMMVWLSPRRAAPGQH